MRSTAQKVGLVVLMGLILLGLAGFWILFVRLLFTDPLTAVGILGVLVLLLTGLFVELTPDKALPETSRRAEAEAEERERVLVAEAEERQRELATEVTELRRLHLP